MCDIVTARPTSRSRIVKCLLAFGAVVLLASMADGIGVEAVATTSAASQPDGIGVEAVATTAVASQSGLPPAGNLPYEVEANCGGKRGVYCVSVHLHAGGVLKPFVGGGPTDGGGSMECRGWSNTFDEHTVKGFTALGATYDDRRLHDAAIVVSGSFHNDGGKPAFPLKLKKSASKKGWKSTFGYECDAKGGAEHMRMLQIRNSEQRAYIGPYDHVRFEDDASAPEIVVGIDPSFRKTAGIRIGRNFVGLTRPHNGGYGTVVFVVARHLRSRQAVEILQSKGCPEDQIIQLDGSTAAQLSVRGVDGWTHPIATSREIPQVFAVFP